MSGSKPLSRRAASPSGSTRTATHTRSLSTARSSMRAAPGSIPDINGPMASAGRLPARSSTDAAQLLRGRPRLCALVAHCSCHRVEARNRAPVHAGDTCGWRWHGCRSSPSDSGAGYGRALVLPGAGTKCRPARGVATPERASSRRGERSHSARGPGVRRRPAGAPHRQKGRNETDTSFGATSRGVRYEPVPAPAPRASRPRGGPRLLAPVRAQGRPGQGLVREVSPMTG